MAKHWGRRELILWTLVLFLFGAAGASGAAVDDVRGRGRLNCGVADSEAGFSIAGAEGAQSGLDADFCRAVAAAVLGDGAIVNFVRFRPRGGFGLRKWGR